MKHNSSAGVGFIFGAALRARGSILLLLFATFAALASDSKPSTNRHARAVSYRHDEIAEVPWSVHIVEIDRSNPAVEFQTTLARGSTFGLTTLTEHLKTVPRESITPLAAINGDYYRDRKPYVGDPKGLQIMRGELISGPCDWSCFWIDASGNPHIGTVTPMFRVTWPNGEVTPFGLNEERGDGAVVLYTSAVGSSTRTSGGTDVVLQKNGDGDWLPLRPGMTYTARVRNVRDSGDAPLTADTMVLSLSREWLPRLPEIVPGMTLKISTATLPDLKGVNIAIGGGPALVHAGKIVRANASEVRHPRSAIGWNKSRFFLVEVDGRQPRLSVGMTPSELASYMVKLGCEEALNLDGGGSATISVYGQVMNNPSEGRERGMANALVVTQKK